MASLNKVILIGNLGRDPEVRYMPNGEAVCNFTIATSDNWKDKQGQKQERTEWHNIVMYRRLAEIAGEYLRKGSSVYVEGRIQNRKWNDKTTGQDRYMTEIVVDHMQMLGGRASAMQQSDTPGERSIASPSSYAAQPTTASQHMPTNTPNFEDFEDDIPF